MKTIIITILFSICCIIGYSQAIVSDPGATAELHTQTAIQSALKVLQEQTKKLAEQQAEKVNANMIEDYVFNYLENMETINKIIDLVSGMVCATQEISNKMEGGYSNCFFNFRYNVTLMKVGMASDFVSLALSARKITAGERVKTLNDVVTRLQEANQEMTALMAQLNIQRKLDRAISNRKTRSTVKIDRSSRGSFSF